MKNLLWIEIIKNQQKGDISTVWIQITIGLQIGNYLI